MHYLSTSAECLMKIYTILYNIKSTIYLGSITFIFHIQTAISYNFNIRKDVVFEIKNYNLFLFISVILYPEHP